MDRSRGPALVLPLPQAKADPPKLRRKLQKNVGKYKSQQAKRPGSGASNEIPAETKCEPIVVNRLIPQAQPSLPLPPDLSDSKWLEYIRKSGFICSLDSSAQSNESLNIPVSIIPEFSHLAVSDAEPRGSFDSLKPPPDSPASSTSTMMRRRAKTPVLRIGQLEGVAPGQTPSIPANKSEVELIAEQYRALLRSRNSMFFDSHSEPPPSRQEERNEPENRANSSEELRTTHHLEVPVPDLPNGSPTSDDGTLVAFEEETVYFKPVSFSPEPLSPVQIPEHPVLSPPPASDNLSLQICLDLLSRELSSAICDRPFRSPSDVPALQIWVMIEAYERLRDQVTNMRLRPDELQPLEAMFDMWLRALYNVHDRLTEGRRSSDSDYDALDSEDLD